MVIGSAIGVEVDGVHVDHADITSSSRVVRFKPVGLKCAASTDDLPPVDGAAFAVARFHASFPVISLIGDSTAGTVDESDPKYFSGTNCMVEGEINPGPLSITDAWLRIGSIVVKESHLRDPNFNPHLRVRFDSTHFPSETDLPVAYTVQAQHGTQITKQFSAKVINRPLDLLNQNVNTVPVGQGSRPGDHIVTQQETMNRVDASFSGDNYQSVPTKLDYDQTAILTSMPYYTALVEYSSGTVDIFGDCLASADLRDNYDDDHVITPANVAPAVTSKVSGIEPPYNLVIGWSPFSATETVGCPLATAFGFSEDFTADLGTSDRCLIGTVGNLAPSQRNNVVLTQLIKFLAEGRTAQEALDCLSAEGHTVAGVTLVPDENTGNCTTQTEETYPVLRWDPHTRLHGVYEFALNDPSQWHTF
jgi:hypothetical protein